MAWVFLQTVLLVALVWAFLDSAGTPSVMGAVGRTVGTLGFFVGVALASRAFRDLGGSFRAAPEPKSDAVLVREGVYGVLRHPMYTAAVLVSVGMLWIRPSPWVLLTAGSVVFFYLLKARYEEGRLRHRYPEYGEHMAATFGVVPWRRG